MDTVTLTSKLNIIRSKIKKYLRDINFKTIIHFKNQQEPTKSCYRAAKCLCLLLEAMNKNQVYKTNFNDWSGIKTYIINNQSRIVQDIYALTQKCESKDYRLDRIISLYEDIFLIDNTKVEINSPKIRHVQYKSVFCFCFFIINYILVNEQLEKSRLQKSKSKKIIKKSSLNSELKKQLNTSKSIAILKPKSIQQEIKKPISKKMSAILYPSQVQ